VAIDEETRKTIAEHIKRTWRSPACVLCGCTVWELYGHATVVLGDAPGSLTAADGLPCCVMVCQRCGNSVLVNMVVADALPRG
jgi:hypothetical protein